MSIGLDKDQPHEVYRSCFEEQFLQETEVYYTAEATKFIEENSVSDYMKKVETRLQEENRRLQSYLHQSTEAELVAKLELVLIAKHRERMSDEFQNLLENDKNEGSEDHKVLGFSLLMQIWRECIPSSLELRAG